MGAERGHCKMMFTNHFKPAVAYNLLCENVRKLHACTLCKFVKNKQEKPANIFRFVNVTSLDIFRCEHAFYSHIHTKDEIQLQALKLLHISATYFKHLLARSKYDRVLFASICKLNFHIFPQCSYPSKKIQHTQ